MALKYMYSFHCLDCSLGISFCRVKTISDFYFVIFVYCFPSKYRNSTNGIYNLKSSSTGENYDVYCHMTDIPGCGGGGWALVMKLDGIR